MTKKQEALNKAKESWKKVVEWWKELWTWSVQVIWWTTWALWYALLSGWEKVASQISESRENDEWISLGEKARRRMATQEYNDRAKKHIVKAWNFGKKTVKWAWKAIKWWTMAVWYALKGGYHLVDAGDKAIWEQIEKKQLKNWKKMWKISNFFRDNILKLLIAAWVAGYGWYEWAKPYMDENKNSDWKEIVINIEPDWNSDDTLLIPTWEYNRLNWKKFTTSAPLTRRYLWWDLENSGDLIIWDTLTLNPASSLHNLWTKKIQKYGQFTNDISKLDSMDASWMTPEEIEDFRFRYPIDATYLFVVKPYVDWKETKDTMSLEQFIKKTNHIVEELKSDTESYEGWLEWVKKDLFDAIRKDIDWTSIVAYAMTELCENKKDWETNKQLFDFLLRNAGANYLSNVPAVYDGKTSYWFYQFTEYALYDRNWEKRWASVVNKVLPKEKKISWSVIDLRTWEDQTKAAYMFALYNINTAIKKLSDNQAKDLLSYKRTHKESFKDNMIQLTAMCHHMPAAWISLKKWYEDKYKSDIFNYGGKHTKLYWEASKTNYEALRN